MEKISIKNNKNEVYKWLTDKALNNVKNAKVLWNFQKYLINENGIFYDYLYPWQQPNCKKVINWLEG